LSVKSFKLRFEDVHVRIVPRGFDGPGVDLRGPEALDAFVQARPMVEWLEAREPGMKIRSLSADLDAQRVLVTFHAGAGRPIVVRVDAPESVDLLGRADGLVRFLAERASEAIAKR
jgi:hypothetical protein